MAMTAAEAADEIMAAVQSGGGLAGAEAADAAEEAVAHADAATAPAIAGTLAATKLPRPSRPQKDQQLVH